ncbi:MAG: 4-alpha-glucanotransferase, partial [Oscillospiraceae bacterium]|nr:4-alpha-glucanotransferase [Oscillospiraceae bacterium]
MRSSGVLMPLSSLPGPYGIGSFGDRARKFVDFLCAAGQRYWQILPLGPTGYGDSPYQSFSAFALNPYFVDLETLAAEGFLKPEELENIDFGTDPLRVDYLQLYKTRLPVLRRAAQRFDCARPDFEAFCRAEKDWLPDYALFMALKEENGPVSMQEWPDGQRRGLQREQAQERLEPETRFWKIVQYWAFKQWNTVKTYANQHQVEIIGDLPIYVSADSAELWASPELFETDKDGRLAEVAGCPPD